MDFFTYTGYWSTSNIGTAVLVVRRSAVIGDPEKPLIVDTRSNRIGNFGISELAIPGLPTLAILGYMHTR